jgi:membrane protein DedA with SNARE-associated domain
MVLSGKQRLEWLRKKAPQIIVVAVAIAIIIYAVIFILEDLVIEGGTFTGGPVISSILSFTHNVTHTVSSLGYIGIFVLMLLESSSLPVPSEAILPFAGYLVSTGYHQLGFWEVTAVATVAAIIGSLIDYYIGLKGIEALTKHKILGRAVFSADQLTFAGNWFKRHGSLTVFAARLVPGLRTIISFPAGAARMPLAKFLVFTTAGCLLWNSVLIYFGYYLGINWVEVAGVFQYVLIGVIVVFVALVAIYMIPRRRKRRLQAAKSV